MGYYSYLTVSGSVNTRIPMVVDLNREIKKLEYSNDIEFDENVDVMDIPDNGARKNYDDEKLATLISKYLTQGQIQLEYYGEDKQWGWRITPNHVVKLKAVLIPE